MLGRGTNQSETLRKLQATHARNQSLKSSKKEGTGVELRQKKASITAPTALYPTEKNKKNWIKFIDKSAESGAVITKQDVEKSRKAIIKECTPKHKTLTTASTVLNPSEKNKKSKTSITREYTPKYKTYTTASTVLNPSEKNKKSWIKAINKSTESARVMTKQDVAKSRKAIISECTPRYSTSTETSSELSPSEKDKKSDIKGTSNASESSKLRTKQALEKSRNAIIKECTPRYKTYTGTSTVLSSSEKSKKSVSQTYKSCLKKTTQPIDTKSAQTSKSGSVEQKKVTFNLKTGKSQQKSTPTVEVNSSQITNRTTTKKSLSKRKQVSAQVDLPNGKSDRQETPNFLESKSSKNELVKRTSVKVDKTESSRLKVATDRKTSFKRHTAQAVLESTPKYKPFNDKRTSFLNNKTSQSKTGSSPKGNVVKSESNVKEKIPFLDSTSSQTSPKEDVKSKKEKNELLREYSRPITLIHEGPSPRYLEVSENVLVEGKILITDIPECAGYAPLFGTNGEDLFLIRLYYDYKLDTKYEVVIGKITEEEMDKELVRENDFSDRGFVEIRLSAHALKNEVI